MMNADSEALTACVIGRHSRSTCGPAGQTVTLSRERRSAACIDAVSQCWPQAYPSAYISLGFHQRTSAIKILVISSQMNADKNYDER